MQEMRIRFSDDDPKKARIKVIGVGGAGGNAINGMIEAQLAGVEFIAINTDIQALEMSLAPRCLTIGKTGLGAGSDPEAGRLAMEEDKDKLYDLLENTDMIFITVGEGGGTGTGASPIIGQVAREMGILTVAVVTKPFVFEGRQRMDRAVEGIRCLKENVDTLILIPNQRLVSIIEKGTPLKKAFRKADEVLLHATRGISDLIMVPGLINLDFADVKAVMAEGGDALMGIGLAEGDGRAAEATKKAITSPFMEDVKVTGAKAVLANITGNLSFDDFNEAHSAVHEAVGDEANIFVGAVIDENMGEEVQMTIIATGFNSVKSAKVEMTVAQKAALATVGPPQVVTYRPRKQVFNRDAIPVTVQNTLKNALPSGKIGMERQPAKTVNLGDRNIPAFLRKTAERV